MEHNAKIYINGKLQLPSNFNRIPFDIYKINNKIIYHVEEYNIIKSPTKIYISSLIKDTGLGLNASKAITLNRFNYNFNNGLYSGNNFELIFVDKVYIANGDDFILENQNMNLIIRSGVGFTWIGKVEYNGNNLSEWTLQDNIYVATQTVEKEITDIVNLTYLDEFDMPLPYVEVDTLEKCKATKGSFYQNGVKIYHNPYNEHDATKSFTIFSTRCMSIRMFNPSANKCIVKDIGFFSDSLYYATDDVNKETYFINCKFHRGKQDSFSAIGKYTVYMLDCIANYGSKDNFNYHTFDANSFVLEINCKGYGAGIYKMPLSDANTTTNSNNGSTAHDGLTIVRLGCSYWDCEGPIVADINNCSSFNLEVSAKDTVATNTGYRTSFLLIADNSTSVEDINPRYLINCSGGGKYIKYGYVVTDGTYVNNFKGNTSHKGISRVAELDGEIYE